VVTCCCCWYALLRVTIYIAYDDTDEIKEERHLLKGIDTRGVILIRRDGGIVSLVLLIEKIENEFAATIQKSN